MTMDKLNGCPFCGIKPTIRKDTGLHYRPDISGETDGYYVGCENDDCPLEIIVTSAFKKKQEAVEAWNKRNEC